MPKLILSSDDFGLSKVYNKRMIEMTQSGLLSSISVLVERDLSGQSSQFATIKKLHERKEFSLGLHLEITAEDDEAVFESQWSKFEDLLGMTPNYVDIHKGHFQNVNFNTIGEFCLVKGVHFRKYNETTIDVSSPTQSLTATHKDLDTIKTWIDNFESNLIYELVFHIGTFDPGSKSSLNKEREFDVEKLRLVHKFISDKGIPVVSYKSLRDA